MCSNSPIPRREAFSLVRRSHHQRRFPRICPNRSILRSFPPGSRNVPRRLAQLVSQLGQSEEAIQPPQSVPRATDDKNRTAPRYLQNTEVEVSLTSRSAGLAQIWFGVGDSRQSGCIRGVQCCQSFVVPVDDDGKVVPGGGSEGCGEQFGEVVRSDFEGIGIV